MSRDRKLDYRNLEALPEWVLIKTRLNNLAVDYNEDLLRAAENGKIEIVMNKAGRLSMILDLLALPKILFPGEDSSNAS